MSATVGRETVARRARTRRALGAGFAAVLLALAVWAWPQVWPETAVAGEGDTTVVFLGGYAVPHGRSVTIATQLRERVHARFVVPVPPYRAGWVGRAWWHWEPGERDSGRRMQPMPSELAASREAVTTLVAAEREGGARRVVLVGCSQGGALALDVGFTVEPPVDGIALLSGLRLADTALPSATDLPIYMSHGRRDLLLPFAVAEGLRDELSSAGAHVTWSPRDAGHDCWDSPDVVGHWLADVVGR